MPDTPVKVFMKQLNLMLVSNKKKDLNLLRLEILDETSYPFPDGTNLRDISLNFGAGASSPATTG